MGHVLTFAQQKGGAGKTTVLAQLAVALADGGAAVGLVDLDPQGSLSRWAAMRGLPLIDSASYRISADLRDARGDFGFVLVDCPGSADPTLEGAIRGADLVVVPCQPSAVDVWATEATLRLCTAERTPARVVLNRVPPRGRSGDDSAAALGALGATVLAPRLGNRVAFARSFAAGTGVLAAAGNHAARDEVLALARGVRAALAEETAR